MDLQLNKLMLQGASESFSVIEMTLSSWPFPFMSNLRNFYSSEDQRHLILWLISGPLVMLASILLRLNPTKLCLLEKFSENLTFVILEKAANSNPSQIAQVEAFKVYL